MNYDAERMRESEWSRVYTILLYSIKFIANDRLNGSYLGRYISNRKVPTTKNLPCNSVPEISGFDENVKLSIKIQ